MQKQYHPRSGEREGDTASRLAKLIKKLPENDFPQSKDPLETWIKAHPFLKSSVEEGNVIRLHPGDHEIYED